MSAFKVRTSPSRLLVQLALLACLAIVVACGDSGGGGGGGGGDEGDGAAGPDEGSISILLTDGPVDPSEFKHIFITFSEIVLIGGPKGNITIFDGLETIDLRAYEDVNKLVAVGRRIPAGSYSKIRLEVTEIELVPADGDPSIFPKLPPKVDFNPQGDFLVRKGRMLLVQIDVDAGNSIHIVGQGNGGWKFRPVVFADVISAPKPGKLVLLEGEIEELFLVDNSFLLCGTHPVSRPNGDDRETDYERDENDDADRDDFCIDIDTDAMTTYFDADGNPSDFGELAVRDEVSVFGRFDVDDGEDLIFLAAVVQVGSPLALDGTALTEVDLDDLFDMELDPGQGFSTGFVLPIQLQAGSKVFRRNGTLVTPEDIEVDDRVRSIGIITDDPDYLMKASVVVLDFERRHGERIHGEIIAVENSGMNLVVRTDDDVDDEVCVEVPEDAEVWRITTVENGLDDGTNAEMIDRSDLAVGDEVRIAGAQEDCLVATKVIVFVEAD